MTRTRLSPEERQARSEAAHDPLTAAVASLTSSERWMSYLQTMRRFRTYSLNNTLLIWAQRPDATRVAGFRAWQALGRQVRKGSKGIAILAPIARTIEVEDEQSGASEKVRFVK